MISRKKIAELIEKESGCYVLNDGNIGYVHLKLKYEPELYVNGEDGYILYIYCNDRKEYKEEIFDEDLFETEEEANWHGEFSCIERTERLELPTWEEFSKWDKSIKFSNNSTKYSMYVFVKNKNTKNCRIIIYADNGEQDWIVFEQPLTQENYTLACRKCKELFLGGSNGDIR